jgi:hypothetical protein
MSTFRKLRAAALLAFCVFTLPPAIHAALPDTVTAATSCIVGTAGATPTITLTFTPPTLNTDGTAITLALTYSVFQGTSSGGEVQVATGLTTSPVVVNTGLVAGTSYYVYIKAVDSNGASGPSVEVCKTIPAAPAIPNPPTALTAS